jgi:hypothetical protein
MGRVTTTVFMRLLKGVSREKSVWSGGERQEVWL